MENHPILTETKDSPHSHLTLRAASDILASAKEALDWAKKCVEEVSFMVLIRFVFIFQKIRNCWICATPLVLMWISEEKMNPGNYTLQHVTKALKIENNQNKNISWEKS